MEGSQRLTKATERAGLASEKPQPVSGRPWPASEEPRGGDGRTDVRTDRFPLYSTGLRPLRFPPGPLPKKEECVSEFVRDDEKTSTCHLKSADSIGEEQTTPQSDEGRRNERMEYWEIHVLLEIC